MELWSGHVSFGADMSLQTLPLGLFLHGETFEC